MSSGVQAPERSERRGPPGERGGVARRIGLAKLPLCHLMAAAALAAYVVRRPALDPHALGAVASVLLLCLGAATLNNYQDRRIDRQLRRTRQRPLASGRTSSRSALLQAATLIFLGTLGLSLSGGSPTLPAAGLLAVLLYNGVYTPLKKKSALAIIPGAVCGAMPVLIGWLAAGGALQSPRLWILMVVVGVWQLPHFWLVVLAHQEDYRSSGIPSFLRILSVRQLRQLVFVWVAAFLVLTLCLPLYRVILSEPAAWVLLANALILASLFALALGLGGGAGRYRGLFRCLNLSLGVVMGAILVEGILRSHTPPL